MRTRTCLYGAHPTGRTAANTGPLLAIALNYGSQAELAGVAQELARRVRDGAMAIEDIDHGPHQG